MTSHPLAQTFPERPVLELACATWLGFEQLYRNHILRRRMILPPTAAPQVGPVVVTVRIPSGDVLTFNATVTRQFRDGTGTSIGVEIIFQKLTAREMKAISRYAAHQERGWAAPQFPHFVMGHDEDEAPASGVHVLDAGATAVDTEQAERRA